MSKSKLYIRWNSMHDRCYNPKSIVFKHYGGRGITICQEWHTFEGFRDWALANGYSEELTLDRKNNDGNYEPNNCEFKSQKHQTRNTRTTVRINSLQTVAQFAEDNHVPYDLVWHAVRLHKDYPDVWRKFISILE